MIALGSWLARLLDPGRGVDELARRLGVDAARLMQIEPSYRSFDIPKRSGGRRTIEAPENDLKHIQRLVLKRVLAGLKAHAAAIGFEKGRSIVHHADRHCGKALVIRVDIVDFFPSTRADRVYSYFRFIGWNRKASRLLTRLTTHNSHLPQGAPTSPRLSNLINYRMDARLEAMIARITEGDGCYSRYADDLTFSVAHERPDDAASIVRHASAIVRDEGYALHRKRKTHILRHGQRQLVTGLVVNHAVNLPREKRRWLRAVEHRLRQGKAATLGQEELAGWRALENMIKSQRSDPPHPSPR